MDDIINKINIINKNLKKLQINKYDDKFIYYKKQIVNKIDDIDDLLNEYLIDDNNNNIHYTDEINKEIKEYKEIKDMLKLVIPYIVYNI